MFSDRVRSRLDDIVNDAARAQTFIGDMDVDTFVADQRTLLAVERLLQRVTEATIQIGMQEMARIAPGVAARKIRDFGNFLRHQYADVDARVIYTIVREDLPPLAEAASRALAA